MKKQLLSLLAFGAILSASAQTVLFEDNFDSYTAGTGVVSQNASWSFWSAATNTDALVSGTVAASGLNSVNISGTTNDLVLPIGPFTTGKYDVKFKMLIPTGSTGAYFNALHIWTNATATYEWAGDVFFDASGLATWTTGFASGGAAAPMGLDTWFDVQITADMDNDMGRLYFNGVLATEWQWSLNNANGNAGTNALAGIDFYGTDASNTDGNYFIDDVQVIESTGVSVKPIAEKISKVSIYPNPTNSNFNIEIPENFVGGEISIIDLTGKVVMKDRILQSSVKRFDASNLNDGIYLIRMNNGATQFTDRLIKK
jgi:hypothetical protein